jgi:acyl carrier protein
MRETTTVPDAETVARTIKALVAEVAGREPGEIGDGEELEALGIDSLLIVEVVVGVQRQFGVEVPPSEFRAGIRTVGQVCAMLGAYVSARLEEARP